MYFVYIECLDSSSNSQSNWASSVERSNIESSWSAPKMRENRMLGFQPQDCGTWNNLGLQAGTWQQGFGTEMTSGHLEARGQVMALVSVPQSAGMVLTNTSLAGGQTVPRFDAYNSMQTQFRRYWVLTLCIQNYQFFCICACSLLRL